MMKKHPSEKILLGLFMIAIAVGLTYLIVTGIQNNEIWLLAKGTERVFVTGTPMYATIVTYICYIIACLSGALYSFTYPKFPIAGKVALGAFFVGCGIMLVMAFLEMAGVN